MDLETIQSLVRNAFPGHAGRPGQRGGSLPRLVTVATAPPRAGRTREGSADPFMEKEDRTHEQTQGAKPVYLFGGQPREQKPVKLDPGTKIIKRAQIDESKPFTEQALDLIKYELDALDKPGRAIRGPLGGNFREAANFIPFSDALGITRPHDAVSGRDLLQKVGLAGEDRGFDASHIAGLALELALDPITWATLGTSTIATGGNRVAKVASEAAQVARKAAATGKVNSVAQATVLLDHLSKSALGRELIKRARTVATSRAAKAIHTAGEIKIPAHIKMFGRKIKVPTGVKGATTVGATAKRIRKGVKAIPKKYPQVAKVGQQARTAAKYINEAHTVGKLAMDLADSNSDRTTENAVFDHRVFERLVANFSGTGIRRETWKGRQWIVAPVSMIVEGVLNGSKGALFYPMSEMKRNYHAWNGTPIVVYHPTDNRGRPLSARAPGVVERSGVGVIRNSGIKHPKLGAEAWFDVEKTRKVDQRVLNALERNQKIEISTGLYTDNQNAAPGSHWNGKNYTQIARNYRPDHLAILPDQVGACSLNDGCGILVNQEGGPMTLEAIQLQVQNTWSPQAREAAAQARRAKHSGGGYVFKGAKAIGSQIASSAKEAITSPGETWRKNLEFAKHPIDTLKKAYTEPAPKSSGDQENDPAYHKKMGEFHRSQEKKYREEAGKTHWLSGAAGGTLGYLAGAATAQPELALGGAVGGATAGQVLARKYYNSQADKSAATAEHHELRHMQLTTSHSKARAFYGKKAKMAMNRANVLEIIVNHLAGQYVINPFVSEKQRRFMYSQHPDIAKRWTKEEKSKGEPAVQPGKKKPTKNDTGVGDAARRGAVDARVRGGKKNPGDATGEALDVDESDVYNPDAQTQNLFGADPMDKHTALLNDAKMHGKVAQDELKGVAAGKPQSGFHFTDEGSAKQFATKHGSEVKKTYRGDGNGGLAQHHFVSVPHPPPSFNEYDGGGDDEDMGDETTNQERDTTMKLKFAERSTLVDNLTTNCDCWQHEGSAEVLNAMPDDQLVALNRAYEERVHLAQLVANSEESGDGSGGGGLPSNFEQPPKRGMPQGSPTGPVRDGGPDLESGREGGGEQEDTLESEEEDDEDNYEGDRQAVKNQLTPEQWLQFAKAPVAIKSIVRNALKADAQEKAQLIQVITTNRMNPFTPKQLNKMTTEQLRPIAQLAGGMTMNQATRQQGEERTLSFIGAAGAPSPVQNRGGRRGEDADDDPLEDVTINWEENAKELRGQAS